MYKIFIVSLMVFGLTFNGNVVQANEDLDLKIKEMKACHMELKNFKQGKHTEKMDVFALNNFISGGAFVAGIGLSFAPLIAFGLYGGALSNIGAIGALIENSKANQLTKVMEEAIFYYEGKKSDDEKKKLNFINRFLVNQKEKGLSRKKSTKSFVKKLKKDFDVKTTEKEVFENIYKSPNLFCDGLSESKTSESKVSYVDSMVESYATGDLFGEEVYNGDRESKVIIGEIKIENADGNATSID
ncbi:MAG: hypothetical protein CME61_06150 [Halobacteriovoraceae bacterium]|nr:hypothetical protein [Halobacteriovoraceae bacterium]